MGVKGKNYETNVAKLIIIESGLQLHKSSLNYLLSFVYEVIFSYQKLKFKTKNDNVHFMYFSCVMHRTENILNIRYVLETSS